jgi:hypothetical protein
MNVPLYKIRDLMNHTDIQTTQIYLDGIDSSDQDDPITQALAKKMQGKGMPEVQPLAPTVILVQPHRKTRTPSQKFLRSRPLSPGTMAGGTGRPKKEASRMSKTTTAPETLPARIFPDWLLPYVQYHRTPDGEEWCHLKIYFPPFWPLEYLGPFQTKAKWTTGSRKACPTLGRPWRNSRII